MKGFKLISLILSWALMLFVVTGCLDKAAQSNSDSKSEAAVSSYAATSAQESSDINEPEDKDIDSPINKMSLRQKVGQMLMVGIEGTEVDDDFKSFINECEAGTVILFGDNITSASQLTQLTNSIKECAGDIPFIIGMDEEGGDVTRLPDDIQSMPSAFAVASSESTDYCYNAGYQIGKQVTAFGLNTGFSPVLDVWTNPENTVIGDRAYGKTSDEVCAYGIADMKGLNDAGAIPVVKHFPGHGDTVTDSHYGLPTVTKTENELWETELIPFKTAIDNNVPAIMVAHMLCTKLDDQYPSSLSNSIVTSLLREEMGFNGVVFTDDLTMGAIADEYSLGQAGVLAVKAGCDVLSVCHGYDNAKEVLEAVVNAVNNGEIDEARINESVKRILQLKKNYNVNSKAVKEPDVDAMNAKTNEFISNTD